MIVELHILQNFAPSNLNRDDTNAPKDCEFGGFRRARISSQCIKRAIRSEFTRSRLMEAEHLSKRTKRLVDEVSDRLANDQRDKATARPIVEFAVNAAGLATPEGKTQYLLFLASESIARFAQLLDQHWTELSSAMQQERPAEKKGKPSKKPKSEVPDSLKNALITLLDGSRAADLALFGRMLADLPDRNIDAACQVAHALSTNKVEMEFDFYTAVDDLQSRDESGAGMMGTVEFNSACFYRYANIDVEQLRTNLGGDDALARRTVEAFLRAAVQAIPTGKQNSMAAQNPPSFVMAVVRDSNLWSLANAFVKPVWPKRDEDLVDLSVRQLAKHWKELVSAYGRKSLRTTAAFVLGDDSSLDGLKDALVKPQSGEGKLDALIRDTMSALDTEGGKA